VGVEKLIFRELAEKTTRHDALQAIFSDLVDIFNHRILGRLWRKRVFQQPQSANALIHLQYGAFSDLWMRQSVN